MISRRGRRDGWGRGTSVVYVSRASGRGLLLLGVGAVIAGCSAEGQSSYCSEVEGVLKDSKAAIDSQTYAGNLGSAEGVADTFEDLQGEYDGIVSDLEDMSPPSDLQSAHDEMLQAASTVADVNGDIVSAFRDSDREEAMSAMNKIQLASKRMDRALQTIIPECSLDS